MKTLKIIPLKNPIDKEVILPGSLSYTIRALNVALLTKGEVRIDNALISDDTLAMVGIIKTLGVKIVGGKNYFTVSGDISQIKDRAYELDVRLSGRTARSILATLCITPGIKTLTSSNAFKKRPVGDLVDGLRQLGANIEYLENEGFLPVKILSSTLNSGIVKIRGEKSSQFISAILMIAPLIGNITIEVIGQQSSKPFIDMTMSVMKSFGINVINENYARYVIEKKQDYINPETFEVEADATAASYFFAIAALTKSRIRVSNLSPDSKQGDVRIVDILKMMGAQIEKNKKEKSILVTGTDTLKGVSVDMNDIPDVVQTLAIISAFAQGITKITGIPHLRIKEADRIHSTKNELDKMGIGVESTNDSLTITGGIPHSALIETYGDHRMAMAFAVAGTVIDSVEIKDPDVVAKSFPEFWETLQKIGIGTISVSKQNIVLIGMRGSGKTTVARLLAKKLNRKYLELDAMLVEKAGMSISEIVEKYGWDHFRQLESQLVKEVSFLDSVIISTGGGVVTKDENISALKKNGQLIFLQAPSSILKERLMAHHDLPALTDKNDPIKELDNVLKERLPLYKKAADAIIDTSGLNVDDVVDAVALKINN